MKDGQQRYQLKEQEHFDRLAESMGETWWGNQTHAGVVRLQRRAQLVAEKLARYQNPAVLELGCGTGTFSKYVLDKLPSLHLLACDISPKAVDIAAANCAQYRHARFEVGDGTKLAYRDNTFDAIIGSSILHHLIPLEKTLGECFRVMKPDGLCWFSEPNMMNPHIAVEKNVRLVGKLLQDTEDETAFFRWSLARTLRKVGFHAVSVQPYDFLHPIVPQPFIGLISKVGQWLEKMPLLREISGSLVICAYKPKMREPTYR